VPYYLFRLITGSDHMHFGWFRAMDEDVAAAQENMMELNLFFRPKVVRRALDIGAGLGATARVLSRHGIAVTSISPDAPLIDYAKRAAGADAVPHPVEFHAVGFEDYRWPQPFDWVLFQESFQYFPDPVAALERAHAALRPGGRLHIGDQFLHVDVPREQGRFHFLPRVLETCKRLGLELHTQCNVSRAAYRMTGRCLEVLRQRADELVAAHSAARPGIAQDVADMLNCGTLEYDAYKQGYLSYQLLTFDRV
ncbi:MAG: class I SAM-dependent methyltransferase, partial [Planctomycetota bacterium]